MELFKANTEKETSKLSGISSDFSNYKTQLEQIVNDNVDIDTIDEIIRITSNLYTSFEFKHNQKKTSNKRWNILDKVETLENLLNKAISNTIHKLDDQFDINQKELKNASNSGLWDSEVKERRNNLDTIATLYEYLNDEVLSKSLFQKFSSFIIPDYIGAQCERKYFKKKLDEIEYKYYDIEWDKNSVELLEAWIKKRNIIDKIKRKPEALGGISLPELISEFKKIGYYENAHKAELLKQDIKLTIDDIYNPKVAEEDENTNPIIAEKRDEISNQQDPGLRRIEEVVHDGPAKSREQSQLKLLDEAKEDLDLLVKELTESFSTRDNFLEDTLEQENQYTVSDKNEERKDITSEVPYQPPIRENGKFLLPVYLSYIDANPNYQWFASMVEEGNVSWNELLTESSQRFSVGQAISQRDYDYVNHILYGLSESRNRGEVAKKHSKNSKFRKKFDSTLSAIDDYLERSQVYLGLSPMEIDNHQAVFGPRNHYNRELCTTL